MSTENVIGGLISVLLVIVMLMLVAIPADYCTSKWTESTALTVMDKVHSGATVTLVPVGKSLMPVTHPESWSISLRGDGVSGTVDVTSSEWNALRIGDSFRGRVRIGGVLGMWWGIEP